MEVNSQFHVPAALPTEQCASNAHWIESWVGPRTGLEAVEMAEVSCPCQESNSNSLAIQPAIWTPYQLSYPSSFIDPITS
jgi:hypothetical protein